MVTRKSCLRIWETLAAEKAMVFLAGPRQSGKTTLARIIGERFANSLYVNWDVAADRARIIEDPTFFTTMPRRDATTPLVIFDEIHKYRHWKIYLKGIHDQFAGDYRFLVTGSGRLDLYQKGGDSLAGRYLLFHPWLSLAARWRMRGERWPISGALLCALRSDAGTNSGGSGSGWSTRAVSPNRT
jgi:hypothetical protein